MYKRCNSFSDQSACVAALGDAAVAMIKTFGYPDADARTVALNNVAFIARYGQMTLNLLDSWVKGDEAVRQAIPQLLGLTTVTPEGVKVSGDTIGKCAKLAMIVLAQFQIENLLRNLHREIIGGKHALGFYRITADLVSKLGLSSSLMEVLNTPARIRNSLHANGIHHRQHPSETAVVDLKGVQYNFVDGAKVDCASWEHCAHALECSLEAVNAILNHSTVLALQIPVMDQYAWEEATSPSGLA